MYNFTNASASAKRKERAFETERLSVSLPAHLVRTSFPESEVLESLLKANADLDHRMSKSLQTWGSYFRRESSSSLFAAPRTLRISVYNLHHRQDGRYRGAPGGPDEPSWTLRIEGKLLGDAKDAKSAKFSQFVKSISIEIPAVASRSEKRLVEWSNSSAVDSDGFELVVAGQSEVKVKILMVISYPMQLYMLAPPLAKLLGVEVETHEQVLRGVWIYCQKQNLATEDETGRLVADDVLRGLFNVASFHLEELPKLIRPMLNSVPPLEFDHLIRVSGAPQDNVQCWDVAVQDPFVPPPNPSRLAQEILQNDRQVAAAMSEISDLARQHAMLVAFSKDPALFVHNLARSNARDFQFLHASEQLESENPLQESNPYLDDIVSQYLLQKRLKSEETSKKRQ